MAIQQWTILKLVGPAADDASERINRWWQARRSDDRSFFTPEDWPARVRRAAADYVSRLVEHRWEMPVVYFSEHIDLWSASGQIQSHLAGATSRIWHDAGELWCYRLPDRGKLLRRNSAIARAAQFEESQWLARQLIEAARAYDKLWPHAVVLVNRRSITASPTDKQLKEAAARPPKWLRRSR